MAHAGHCLDRKGEWIGSAILGVMGFSAFIAPLIHFRVSDAAASFGNLGLPVPVVALIFMVIGFVSCVALYANGHWQPVGSYVRALGCALRLIIWVQLTYGGIITMLQLKMILFVTITWAAFTLVEGWGLLRVLDDVQKVRANGNARGAA